MTPADIQGWHLSELTYCSNVHAGESLDDIISVIKTHLNAVKQIRLLPSMHAGLWISNQACIQFHNDSESRQRFINTLDEHGIRLVSINGFPYGNFHSDTVKEQVYTPDWSQPERYRYTLNLAKLLAKCLPADERVGTISTLPLGFGKTWSESRHESALRSLCNLAVALDSLEQNLGKRIIVCLEMEPGCVLEKTPQLDTFFHYDLKNAAEDLGLSLNIVKKHIGICFDVCHQAVMFEDISASLNAITSANITIGKIQLSSALHLQHPETPSNKQLLSDFDEPRYLHQVATIDEKKQTVTHLDLAHAISDPEFPNSHPWRIHFHVPVQSRTLNNKEISTTQNELYPVFDFLRKTAIYPHLEVETYTWQVLPESIRPTNSAELHAGLVAELDWVSNELKQRNLLL